MLKLLKKLNKKEWGIIFICLILIIGQVWLDLKLPDYMKDITVLVQTKGSTIWDVLEPGLYMTLCAFGSLVSSFIVGYFASYIAASFSKRLRSNVFSKVSAFGMEEIKKFSTSSLITRTTNDVTQVQMIIAIGLQMLIKAPILAVWAILKIYSKGWEWTALTGGAVIVLFIMIGVIVIAALPKFKVIQKLTDNLNGITRENLTGIRVVRAYNAEGYQENKFAKANNEVTVTNLFVQKVMAIMSPGMTIIMSGLTLGIYIIGAYLIDAAAFPDKLMLFSNMVVFSSYAVQVVIAFVMLTITFILYPRASVSAKRILEVLDTKEAITSGIVKKISNKQKGEIEFRNVSFKYPDAEEYILEDINFTAHKGETVAFIGSTGCGKSTLINLIPRFYDATEGQIFIDGIDVKDYDLNYLNDKLGYIPQKAVLFSGTVKFNIAYGEKGKKITKEQIETAVKVAQGKDFVEKMPKKYDSHIAQSGTNISGGQKQRLAIARAIAKNPEIYIFDDSFSALDYRTDYVLRTELKKYTKDATTLIVAQRIGTIRNADKIIVLDDGKIVGMGTHKDLLESCEIYKEIALSQLSKEELANA